MPQSAQKPAGPTTQKPAVPGAQRPSAQPARRPAPAAAPPYRRPAAAPARPAAPARSYTLPNTGTGGVGATHGGLSIVMLLAVLAGTLGAAMAGWLRLRRVA